jgi:hypothetical protein
VKNPKTEEPEALYDADDLIGYDVEQAIQEHLNALKYRLNPHMARGTAHDWDEVKGLIEKYLGHWQLPEEVMQEVERKRLRLKQDTLAEQGEAPAPTPSEAAVWHPQDGHRYRVHVHRAEEEILGCIFPHPRHPGYFVVLATHILPGDDDASYQDGFIRGIAPQGISIVLKLFGLPTDPQAWTASPNDGTWDEAVHAEGWVRMPAPDRAAVTT